MMNISRRAETRTDSTERDRRTEEGYVSHSLRKIALAGLILLGVIGTLVGAAFATFTESAAGGPQTISSGKVIYVFGSTQANRLAVSASNIAAGDTIQRAFELDNNSTINTPTGNSLASVTIGASASTSSLLNSDPTNGLQAQIQACSVAWTEAGTGTSSSPYTYTCSGTTSTVLASTPMATLISTPVPITSGLNSLATGGKDYLVLTLTLPSSAPGNLGLVSTPCSGTSGGTSSTENLEGCSSVLNYTFTGTQRNGISE